MRPMALTLTSLHDRTCEILVGDESPIRSLNEVHRMNHELICNGRVKGERIPRRLAPSGRLIDLPRVTKDPCYAETTA